MLNKTADLINKNISVAQAAVNAPVDPKCDGSITVAAPHIYKVCEFLRFNKEMPFNVLQCISGVDYVEYLEVCYMLAHFDVNEPREFILKVKLNERLNPALDSIVNIYPAANFQERECYDMFGVRFNNHPDHRRILCPDDWEGYSLRKDYVTPKFYNGMEVNPDMKMNFEDREYMVRQDMIKKAQKAASQDA